MTVFGFCINGLRRALKWMQGIIRKFICWLIGHRYRCLYRHLWGLEGNFSGSSTTAWECQCCGHQDYQQWDT